VHLAYLITYLLTQLARAYEIETDNIWETVEDRAKATIDGLYKVILWLSIAAKMYDLESVEWSLSEILGHWFLKCRKNGEIRLSNDSDAMPTVESFAFGN